MERGEEVRNGEEKEGQGEEEREHQSVSVPVLSSKTARWLYCGPPAASRDITVTSYLCGRERLSVDLLCSGYTSVAEPLLKLIYLHAQQRGSCQEVRVLWVDHTLFLSVVRATADLNVPQVQNGCKHSEHVLLVVFMETK